jgi:hypothetical protein
MNTNSNLLKKKLQFSNVKSNNLNNSKNSIFSKFNFSNNNNIKKIIISILVVILLLFIFYVSYTYYNYENTNCYQKKSFYDYFFDFYNTNICIRDRPPIPPKQKVTDPNVSLLSLIEDKKEVFHISNQDYTYDQAKCKCESYGARLANKNELIDAFNKGANWCSYGWMEKQSAYYPVQKCEWDKIQTSNERLPDNKKTYCGVPGLNGGYFANPQLKFGATCYGIKPKGSISKMKKPYCPPMNFCKLESNFQASNKLDTDEIVGFNNEQWNMA